MTSDIGSFALSSQSSSSLIMLISFVVVYLSSIM